MKIKEIVDKINRDDIKKTYGSKNHMNRTGEHDHIVTWEQDREWKEINRLKTEGKL